MDYRIPTLIERDGVLCHYCGCQLKHNPKEGYHPQGVSIDHIIPQKRGGSDDLGNLVLCCRRCNSRKHTRDYWDFRLENETTQMILFMMEAEAL